MQIRLPSYLPFSLALVIPLVNVCAEDIPDPNAFDRNGDGHLDQAELDIYGLHVADKRFRDWDINRDGKIEFSELKAEIKKANDDAPKTIRRQRSIAANIAPSVGVDLSKPIRSEDAYDLLGLSRPRPKYKPNWFRLRGKVSDFSILPKKGLIENVSPAVFSWSRDFVGGGDTWTARGAVGGFWKNHVADLSLGVEFDRLETNLPEKADTDTLVFRILASGEPRIKKDSLLLDALALRFGLDYGTNFDFSGATFGGAFEMEPVWKLKAFRGIQSLFGKGGGWSAWNAPSISLRNYLRVEGGETVDEFVGMPAIDDSYLRLGPQFEAKFWPFGIKAPMSLSTSYGFYAEVVSDGANYHNFRVGTDWRIDEKGHFSFRLEYVDGVTPLLLQDQESLLLSLSARH